MADLVEDTVAQIRARLNELAPVVSAYQRLEAAYAAPQCSSNRQARPAGRHAWLVVKGGSRRVDCMVAAYSSRSATSIAPAGRA
jgi:hypothetical protein